MNKKMLLITAFIGITALIGWMMPSASGLTLGGPAASLSSAAFPQAMGKDETVYGILNEDGSVASVYVVNHFRVPEDGLYSDSGNYEKVESLSHRVEPSRMNGSVQWALTRDMGDFYAKGSLQDAALPWLFEIAYSLDGKTVTAQELAGKTGAIEIRLSVKPNPQADAWFKEHFAMQIQVPVNLENSRLIKADGAVAVLTGHTNTLTYTLLPGDIGTFTIQLDAEHFEMDSMTAGLTRMDYASSMDLSSLTEGFEAFGDGMEEMTGGTRALKSGLEALADGVAELAGGMERLSGSGSKLVKGMTDYQSGLKRLAGSLQPLCEGSKSVNAGLKALSSQGSTVLAGYQQLAADLSADLPGEAEKAQLQALAQSAQSPDPATAQLGRMAQALLEQMNGLEKMSASLEALNNGLSQYTVGVTQLATQYEVLNTGLAELSGGTGGLNQGFEQLVAGTRSYVAGADDIAEGLSAMNDKTKELPGETEKLLNGQLQLKDGLDQALASINGMIGGSEDAEKMVSFVDPENGTAASVQFVMRTPAIHAEESDEGKALQPTAKKGFVEKFLALFTGEG